MFVTAIIYNTTDNKFSKHDSRVTILHSSPLLAKWCHHACTIEKYASIFGRVELVILMTISCQILRTISHRPPQLTNERYGQQYYDTRQISLRSELLVATSSHDCILVVIMHLSMVCSIVTPINQALMKKTSACTVTKVKKKESWYKGIEYLGELQCSKFPRGGDFLN